MTPARVPLLVREMKLSALDPGTSGELRSVCPSSFRFEALFNARVCFALTLLLAEDGDIFFQAPRRFWNQKTVAPSYAYIFTDPQPSADPAVGVFHSVELPYLFGGLAKSGPPKVAWLSRVMLDYWISFAVSLTPNDGKGTSSELSYASIFFIFILPLILLSSGPYWGMYGETKVRFHAPPNPQKKYSICPVQEVLELNGNDVQSMPDVYRAASMDVMIGMSETLSW